MLSPEPGGTDEKDRGAAGGLVMGESKFKNEDIKQKWKEKITMLLSIKLGLLFHSKCLSCDTILQPVCKKFDLRLVREPSLSLAPLATFVNVTYF